MPCRQRMEARTDGADRPAHSFGSTEYPPGVFPPAPRPDVRTLRCHPPLREPAPWRGSPALRCRDRPSRIRRAPLSGAPPSWTRKPRAGAGATRSRPRRPRAPRVDNMKCGHRDDAFRVGCESFLEGSHGDRAYVGNDEPATAGYTTLRGTTPRWRRRRRARITPARRRGTRSRARRSTRRRPTATSSRRIS